jgi:hypothetical protein
MDLKPVKYPFEAELQEIISNPDGFVTAVFSSLASEFLVLPKGEGFVEYPHFECRISGAKEGYRQLLCHTSPRDHRLSILNPDISGCDSLNPRYHAARMGLCDKPTQRNRHHAGVRPQS